MIPDVSIVIVSYNTRELLLACLRSVVASTHQVSLEVIVVDNGSADDSASAVRRAHPGVHMIANRYNCGFAAANNQGLRRARGRYLLLLNSDTEVRDRCLDRMVFFADANPYADALGCRVLNPDGTVQPSCMLFPTLTNLALIASGLPRLFPRSRLFGRESMTWWTFDDVRAVDVIKGCFLLVRRRALHAVGLLDERFFLYAEETDWCMRLRRAGRVAMFAPCGEIVHYGGASTAGVSRQMIPHLWGSMLKFIRKYHSRPYTVACELTIGLFFLFRAGPLLLASVARPGRRERAGVYLRGVLDLVRGGADRLCRLPASARVTVQAPTSGAILIEDRVQPGRRA